MQITRYTMELKVFLIALMLSAAQSYSFTSKEVKCHVCKATIDEMQAEISKVDSKKMANINGFRLDSKGNSVSKTVQLVKSEMYLTELMENICEKMDDYVKATFKSNGKFTLLKMIVDGHMNPLSSEVDFVQDGDLNKSLKHFCLEILEDHEQAFLNGFQATDVDENLDIKICTEEAKYCADAPYQEEYNFDEYKSEL